MPAILEWTHTVVEHDLDGLGHANNISYLKWMQSAALAHSAAQGWPAEAYAALGCGWVVRSHFIEYLVPALLGDTISIVRPCASPKRRNIDRQSDSHEEPGEGLRQVLAVRWQQAESFAFCQNLVAKMSDREGADAAKIDDANFGFHAHQLARGEHVNSGQIPASGVFHPLG